MGMVKSSLRGGGWGAEDRDLKRWKRPGGGDHRKEEAGH